ncbi:hypothetical protein HmCmsJML259_00011 [Escherichia coli]|nr:hypothetical protein ExPECSC049_03826 [Escherichia coli]GDB23426.1 hypothetical protein HmCmsJML259_00011 [Escherichia coli]
MPLQIYHWQRRMYRVVDFFVDCEIAAQARMEYVFGYLPEMNSKPLMEPSLNVHSLNLYNIAEKDAYTQFYFLVFH